MTRVHPSSLRRLFACCAGALLLSAAAFTQSAPPTRADLDAIGPQVGERVPDFTLTDQTGTARTLKSILRANGAMLVFFRSAEW